MSTPLALQPAAPAPAALPPPVRPWSLDWVLAGLGRRWGSALVALVCAWSGVWIAVWLLVADTLVGTVLSAFGSAVGSALVGGGAGPSPASGALSIVWGAIRGAGDGLWSTLLSVVGGQPLQLGAALAGGLVVALILVTATVALEPWLLRLEGHRRMSRREAARITPLLGWAAADLGLAVLPAVLIADGDERGVRATARHLVIGRSLLEVLGEGSDADAELGAVLCHGLHHWAGGDGLGLLLIRCCGLPLALLYDAGCWLAQQSNALIATVGWVLLWPAWMLVRLVIGPISAAGSRRQEYAADAAVLATGRGAALHRALSLLGELEPGRLGWDRVVAASHPPLELRLEALEPEG